MGKGNLLQGMGRGKLGDTVFYRQNGSQMFRVRNRMVKNPKSGAQQIQRALMATIVKSYSVLQKICNHSFENVEYGAKSQAYFVKKNLGIIREAAVGYVKNNLTGIGKYNMPYIVAPGSIATYAPNELIISEGSLQQKAFNIDDGDPSASLKLMPNINQGKLGNVADFLSAIGNRMYTFILVRALDPIVGVQSDGQGKALFATKLLYSRISRNDVPLTEEDAVKKIDGSVPLKYLSVESNMEKNDLLYNWFLGIDGLFSNNDIAVAVIASEWSGTKWLRSTESLKINKYGNISANGDFVDDSFIGLDFAYGLGLWTNTNKSMVTSDKLLNGGKLEADPNSFRPVS